MPWFYLALASLNSCIGNLLLKYSRIIGPADATWWGKFLSPWFIGGMCFYVINVLLFAKALDRIPVSIGYPILAAGGFALLAIASHIFLGERLSLWQAAGLVLVVVGIFCLSLEGRAVIQ